MSIARSKSGTPWLLLTFSLPAKRASQRVEVWRRLQRHGAVALGNSGYVLPNDPVNRERFEWLATLIRNCKGDASVLQVHSIDTLSSKQLMQRFAKARARDFLALIRQLEKIASQHPQKRAVARINRLRRRFQEVVAIDFFHSSLRERAEKLLEAASSVRAGSSSYGRRGHASRKDYKGRLWVTRLRPGVDRVSSAWLIRRFIDVRARFGFAPEDRVPVKAVPFDTFGGGFGHRGEDCTFETLQKQFRINDRKVKAISEVIHDADLCDDKFGRKEGFGIDEILKGWDRIGIPDREILQRGMQMIEGLYHSVS